MLTRLKRVLKHRWLDDRLTHKAMPPEALARLTEQVRTSEQRHSGEIRICVETGLPTSYLWRDNSMRQIIRQRALTMFGKLRVWDTENNNGVLVYLLLTERAIEIVADRGLNAAVSPHMWAGLVKKMGEALKSDNFEKGLALAVEEVTALLIAQFPLTPGQPNPNELPDQPVLN